ncbi:MAG: hypothetical protein K0S34_77 [Bacillales bacterium]|nr:hypothetical protein [Bacillales bacterium]
MKKIKRPLIGLLLASNLAFWPSTTFAVNEYTVLGVADYNYSPPDLNNGDAFKFRDRMAGLSWTKTKEYYDSYVWDSDFTNAGNNSDILYFTGHGNDSGELVLQNYGGTDTSGHKWAANYDRVGLPRILGYTDAEDEDAEWMIFASCSSLYQLKWGRQLDSGLHMLLGYYDTTNDYTDTNIINNFIDRAFGKNGYAAQKIFDAWRFSNNLYGENQWAVIGHSSNINDYVHGVGSGATADVLGVSDVYRYFGTSAANYSTLNISSYSKSSDSLIKPTTTIELDTLNKKYKYKFSYKSENINIMDIVVNNLGIKNIYEFKNQETDTTLYNNGIGTVEHNKDGSLVYSRSAVVEPIQKTQDQVKDEVINYISKNGGYRSDLELLTINPELRENENGSEIIGYIFNFVQKSNDTYIDGYAGNAITIGVDANGINFYKRNVKEIDSKVKLDINSVKKIEDIIEIAEDEANNVSKSTDKKKAASGELVIFTPPVGLSDKYPELIPAYKINTNDSSSVYINILTGETIKLKDFYPEYINKYDSTQTK